MKSSSASLIPLSSSSASSGSVAASLSREEALQDLEEHEVDKLDFIDYITQLSKLESTHKIVFLERVPFVVSMRVIRPFRNAITSEEHYVTTSNHCALLNPQHQQHKHVAPSLSLSVQDHQLPNQTTISLLNNFAMNEQYYAGGDISNSCVLAGGGDGGRTNNGAGSFTQSLANDVQQLKHVDQVTDRIKQQALRLLLTCTNGGDEYYEADLGFDDLQEHRKKISMSHISWANYLQYLRNGLFIFKRGEKSVVDDPSESDITLQFDEENKESKDVVQLVIYSPLKNIPQTTSSDQQHNSQHSISSSVSNNTNGGANGAILNIRLKFLFELYAIRHISDFTQKLQQLLLDLVCHGNALSEIRALKDAKIISDLRNELQETRQKLRQAQDRLILYQPSTSGGHDLGGLNTTTTDDHSSSSDQERKNSSAPKRKAPKSLLNPNQKKRGQAKGAKIQ